MYMRMAVRLLSTISRIPQVCIVGAGPAGFYAAMHLTKHLPNINVDILEKLPVPFGLIRFGVAPDHPEVKNVINQFTKVAQQKNVNFYGNVELGRDVNLVQLQQHYDAVLLTYGAEEDKTLGIENEDGNNIIAARNFVGWYNGLPRDKDLKINLSGHSAAILGQGNVALDVARILLSPIDELRKTDIPEYALNAIAESKLKEVFFIGRRGPLQVAFTIKELREQLKLKTCRTVWREQDFVGVSEAVSNLARPRKRLIELMLKSLTEQEKSEIKCDKTFRPIFCRSPHKFLLNDKNDLAGIELICNKLEGSMLEEQKCVATDDREIIDCSLAFRSIGYKSFKADNDLIFNSSGVLINDKGRVIQSESEGLAKLYVAGWLGTGPVGVILHTMGNAFGVAKTICADLQTVTNSKGGFEAIRNIISKSHCNVVDWRGWENINKFEIEQGKKLGKPREKVTDIKQMLEIASM